MFNAPASLHISAAHAHQFPKPLAWEFVVVGRSNVGKSSLINRITQQKNLAYVGKQPGKTRLINFYDCGAGFVVDVPGYGYAKRSQAELKRYGQLMEAYFQARRLDGVLILVDARHALTQQDLEMIDYVKQASLSMLVIANKIDKCNQAQRTQAKQRLDALGYPYVLFSSQKNTDIAQIHEWMNQQIDV
jgi:GTP-binding protein